MVKVSKRYQKALEVLEPEKRYTLEEAVSLLKRMPSPKFDETVELSARLSVDPKQSDQMVRGTVSLPHGSGKKITILVFTENPDEAKAAGADYAGLDDLIARIQEGWLDFDVALATPDAMKQVRTVARVLGPRGLMPNPRSGTVTDDIAAGVNEVKAGRVEYKMDKTANVAIVCGKRSFDDAKLKENVSTVIQSLGKARPTGFKGGRFIKSLTLNATMSPGIRLDSSEFASF
ncbi:MAG: 50S ribosomal protein L1 [Opitutales bacterium]